MSLDALIADHSTFQGDYRAIASIDDLKRYLEHLWTSVQAGKPLAFDVETGYTGPNLKKGALDVYHPLQFVCGFSVTDDVTRSRYIPLRHDFSDANLDPEIVWPLMKPLLEEATVVAHNWLFEARNLRALERKGDGPAIELDWRKAHDTMLQSYVLSETQVHNLKDLTMIRYGYDQTHIETLFDKKLTAEQERCLRFNPLDVTPAVVNYVCDDVTWSLRLDRDLRRRCETERGKVYLLERQILDVLLDVTDTGISVDWAGVHTDLGRFDFFYQQMEAKTRRMFEEATGRDLTSLNFRSVPQMRELLFDNMGLESTRMTKPNKEGNQSLSTDETALEALRHQHPAVDQLLKYRQTKKMGEWFQLWDGLRTSADDRVHPTFNQVRVQSGRFASDSPNVQNITKYWWFTTVDRDWETYPDTKDGEAAFRDHVKATGTNGIDYWTGNARDFLIASPGYSLLVFDYSSAEMRILAGITQDPYLINAFRDGVDVHKVAASLAFKVPFDQVSPEQRQRAKAVQFGLVYGQQAQGLADGLGISKAEAQSIMNQYFAAFTKVDAWFSEVKRFGSQNGYVESFLGRKSTLWDLISPYKHIRSKAERMMVNIPIQGGAADYCKIAMVQSKKALVAAGWWGKQVRMLMNQHDSLVFEVSDDLDLAEVRALLEPTVNFPVPRLFPTLPDMKVDWSHGQRWGSVKDFDTDPTPDPTPIPVQETIEEMPDLDLDIRVPDELVLRFQTRPAPAEALMLKGFLLSHPGDKPVRLILDTDEIALNVTVAEDVMGKIPARFGCQAELRQLL